MMRWKCASCGGFHTYIPDLKKGLHVPTADYAFRMGYQTAKREPRENPPTVVTCLRCGDTLDSISVVRDSQGGTWCIACDEASRQMPLFGEMK